MQERLRDLGVESVAVVEKVRAANMETPAQTQGEGG